MEYIYAALLLHKSGQKITEEAVMKILTTAGISADASRTKALIAALEGINIEEALKSAAVVQAAPAAGKAEEKKEEKKEEKVSMEEAAAGLGSLFG